MARPNGSDIRPRNVPKGTIRYLPDPNLAVNSTMHHITSVSRYHKISHDIGKRDKPSDWLIANLGAVAIENLHTIRIIRRLTEKQLVIEIINNYCTMLSKITRFVTEEGLSSTDEC